MQMLTEPEQVGLSGPRLARIGPSSAYPIRRELRVLTYQALIE